MKKLLLLILQIIICSVFCKAQTPNWMWAYSFGGSGYQYASGAAVDDSDHVYVSGRFGGGINIGSFSATAGGAATLYIAKFDTAGDCLWLASHAFSSGYDYPQDFYIDHATNNHVYSCGIPNSSDPGGYLIKYTSGSSIVYDPTFGPGGFFYGEDPNPHGIAADTAGDVYMTGETGGGSYSFGDSTIDYAGEDLQEMFLTKMDNTGNFLWAVGMNGLDGADDGYDVGRNVAIDYTGQYVYVAGSYTGTPSFHSRNPSLWPDITGPASTYANLFIAKYDTAGDLIWVTYGINAGIPDNSDVPWSQDVDGSYYGLAVDSCDNVFIDGTYLGTATFGQVTVTSTNTGYNDGFVASCNSNGEWQWAKDIGSNSTTSGEGIGSIAVDKDNDVYVAGWISKTANFGDGITATASAANTAFIAKYASSTGDAQWALAATGSGTSICAGVAVDKQKFVYISGSYSGLVSIGGNNLTNNSFGIFIAKLDTVPARYIVPVVDSSYCAGETTTLTYTTVGTFNNGNTFTAELSDSTGSFVNDTIIGTVNSTTGGTITITIPAGTKLGSTYLIRVVSSNPATSSYVNGCGAYYQKNVYVNNFYITISTNIAVSASPDSVNVCSSSGPVLLTATSGSGVTYNWTVKGNTTTLATTDTFTIFPTTNTTYYVAVSNTYCSGIDSVVVSTNSVSPLTIQPQSPTTCAGQSITLSVDTSGRDYTWNPTTTLNSSTTDSVIATPYATITYTVTGKDSLGCVTSGMDTVYVKQGPSKPKITQNGNILTSSATQGNKWERNDTILTGATNQTYMATISGWYQVTAENPVNGCSTTSDSIYIMVSGINQLSINPNQVSIYPNPTGGELFVNISSSVTDVKDWNLQITDVLGRTVYTKLSLNYSNDIDLSNLASGVYFITVINKTARAVVPVVKQN